MSPTFLREMNPQEFERDKVSFVVSHSTRCGVESLKHSDKVYGTFNNAKLVIMTVNIHIIYLFININRYLGV